MREQGFCVPAALAAAFSAPNAAKRRRIACMGVSPGMMSDVPCRTGVCASDSGISDSPATAVSEIATDGIGVPVPPTPGDSIVRSDATGFTRRFRRFIGFRPSSRLSHSLSASSEISTPTPRNAVASTSTESPSRRSRSSSSRCGSSCAVFDCRAWRALAANSASVGGAAGVDSWLDGGGLVVMWERYAERPRSAMGVLLPGSKRIRLDVGVLTYFFLWFFLSGFTSLSPVHLLSGFIFRCAEVFQFRSGEFDQLMRFEFFTVFAFIFSGWIEWMIRGWSCSVACSLSSLGFCGGRLC